MSCHPLRSTMSLPLALAALVLLPSQIAADGPTRLNSMDLLVNIRTPGCMPVTAMTPGNTLIQDAEGCPTNPVRDPDGNPLTLGAFRAAQGTISASCVHKGSHTSIHFTGLIPKGVYTVWLIVYGNGGPPQPPTAAGTVGTSLPDDPRIKNVVIASESGEGQVSLITEEGQLSIFGPFDGCLLDGPETHIELVYHHDGNTNGPVPGPANTWVPQEVFVFN